VLSLGAILGVAACGPPPSPPGVLPGNPHFTGQQVLSEVIGVGGNVFVCSLILDTEWDLGYRIVTVNAKTSSTGPCLSTDWYDKRAIGSCAIGTSALSCGAAWPVPVTPTFSGQRFVFDPTTPPHLGIISVDFSATLTLPSGLSWALTVHGETPHIRCSIELTQCKFQT
jgi:hypothetical protein